MHLPHLRALHTRTDFTVSVFLVTVGRIQRVMDLLTILALVILGVFTLTLMYVK
jgi:hypothetical protein